jgi:D-aminopeptidase
MRPRELGIRIGNMPTGRFNAITDVEGVGVGHSTIIRGNGPLKIGEGPVRAGVTAIVPHRGNPYYEKVVAAVDIFNAYGKTVGLPQIMHMGVMETPILLTDTLNTWKVADALIDYLYERYQVDTGSINPVVGETNGGFLNDSLGRHVGRQHVFEAVDNARSLEGRESVHEGSVGGGTPMSGFGFKGGIGTASRKTEYFTLGVLVQLNCGRRKDLRIDGIPVGKELSMPQPNALKEGNSIVIIFATDLSLTSRQLQKVAKRTIWGVVRVGHYGSVQSGDFTIGFTTGRREVEEIETGRLGTKNLGTESYLDGLYRAAIEATEEAVLNALFMAETMVGRDGNTRKSLPIYRVRDILKRHM